MTPKNKLRLKKAKKLRDHYVKLGETGCYCDQNSSSECPAHIEDYINSMEWTSTNNHNIHDVSSIKGKKQ